MAESNDDPVSGRGLGLALLRRVSGVVESYTTRMRKDPEIPRAAALPAAQLEDHATTFLSDVFQALVVLGDEVDGGADSELLRDGSTIQRLIGDLHGRQRHRLGWTETALRREYRILIDEVEGEVTRQAGNRADEWIALLHRSLRAAEQASLNGFAAAEREGRPPVADAPIEQTAESPAGGRTSSGTSSRERRSPSLPG
jgi:hypothetical protein